MHEIMAKREITGQGEMAGMERREPLDNASQVSFAGALRYPENWGVQPLFLDDRARYEMSLMAPERIESALIGVGPNAPSTTGYRDGETGQLIRVALTPIEYSFISRNVASLGEASVNKTLASRPPRQDFEPDQDAARRSGVHTAQSYIAKIDIYITKTLEPDRVL